MDVKGGATRVDVQTRPKLGAKLGSKPVAKPST